MIKAASRGIIDLSALAASQNQAAAVKSGVRPLGLDTDRDGFLIVPKSYNPSVPAPLIVSFHGAGCSAKNGGLWVYKQMGGDRRGAIGLIPDSRGRTWDMIRGGWGPDVAFVSQALETVLRDYNIDRSRMIIAGFSDGASYALSLGLANGHLFQHVAAFSPGYMTPPRLEGRPRVFVAHGTRDRVLNIDRCSRRVVPQLQQLGHDVRYEEFDGPHTVRHEDGHSAAEWLLG